MTEEKSIFEIASEEASRASLTKIDEESEVSIEEKNKEIALYISKNPGREFEELQKAIEGPFAEKFMNIMNSLPDREFMRYYLKTLEYFKPKVTRVEPEDSGPKEDNVIQVNIMQVNQDGEIKTITINSDENNGI